MFQVLIQQSVSYPDSAQGILGVRLSPASSEFMIELSCAGSVQTSSIASANWFCIPNAHKHVFMHAKAIDEYKIHCSYSASQS